MPHLPNVERFADMSACLGRGLDAISADLPLYPKRAWSRSLQGWVIIQFDVNTNGKVNNARVTRSVPGGSFNTVSLSAVKKWVFKPVRSPLKGCAVLFEFNQGHVKIR